MKQINNNKIIKKKKIYITKDIIWATNIILSIKYAKN